MNVIIPSYNQQEFLSDAIESVLPQIRRGWDLLTIVDDGSTDSSLEIAKKYIDEDKLNPKVKVIAQINKGLASARNTGIMNSEDEWLLFLDADDMLMDGTLEKIRKVIEENSEADIIAPSLKTFGTSNQEIILMKDPKIEDFRTGNKIGYCCAIRKSKLLEIGGYSPKMVEGYEDLHLTCNLLARGAKIKTIPEVLWLYRTKEKSMYRDITPEIHQKLIAQINKDVPEAQLNFFI